MNYLEVVVTEMARTAKQTKSRMVESAELAQALMHCPGLGIYIVQDGKFQYANSFFQELTGYTEQELRSIHPLDLVHPEDRELVREKAIENLKGHGVLPYEYRFIKKNGEIMWNLERLASIEYMGKQAAVGSFMDVTDSKRMEEALRLSERNFHDSMENSPLGIRVLDKNYKTLYANRALLDMWGYSSVEEMEAVPGEKRYTPEGYAGHLERLEKRERGEPAPLSYETSIVRSDGQVRIIWASRGELLWDGEKRFQIVYQDITERKKAEEALQESREALRKILESATDGISLIDLNGVVIETNQRTVELHGFGSKDEVLGKNALVLIAPGDHAKAIENKRQLMKEGIIRGVEYNLVGTDGSEFPGEISSSLLKDASGNIVGQVTIARDITKRKQLQEALAKSEERYRTVLDQMEDAYFEVDIAGNFTFVNDAMCRQLGYSREELMGRNYRLYTPEAEGPLLYKVYNQIYKTGKPVKGFPTERIRKDGRRIFTETAAFPLRNEGGEIIGFRGIMRDVTERRQFEQKLAELATHDALTGLPNRTLLRDRFTVALELSRRNRNSLALMVLDLDRFKAVNDSMGHDVGDKLLKAVGERLELTMRKSDTVARIGGDEFVVLLPQIPHVDEAAKFAQRILDALRKPFVFNGYRPQVTTSIGIAVYPEGGKDIETLLKNADTAMYWAKEQGRDIYRFYDGSDAATLLAKRRALCA